MPKEVKARLRTALKKNSEEMEAAAKRDVGEDSGELKRSIKSEEIKEPGLDLDGLAYKATAGTFYAYFEEFGTSAGRGSSAGRPANPFFFTNYRALKPRFKRRNSRAIREGQKDAIKKNGG